MPNVSEKAARFTAAIMDDALTRARDVEEAVKASESAELTEFEAQTLAEAERRVAAGLELARSKEEKRVTAGLLKSRRALLQYREDCAQEVFDELRERVAAYPDRPEYEDTLCELLFKAVGALPGTGGVRVYLRPADLRFADRLRREAPNAELSFAEGGFALGGLIAESEESAMRVDMSFESALEDLSGRFSELTGFDLEDGNGE